MNTKSTKAAEILQVLEKDYKNSLVLCQRIRTGLKAGIAVGRIRAYAEYFFASQLLPLFNYEEEHLFPLLGVKHQLVKRSISQHQLLKHLLEENEELAKSLEEVIQELEDLVQFKEEEFFPELKAGKYAEAISQLRSKEKEVLTPDPENWEDKFWLKGNFLTTSASF